MRTYHIHLLNSEIGAIESFNRGQNHMRVDYNGAKRRFVVTAKSDGRLIETGAEVWSLLERVAAQDSQEIERLKSAA